MRRIVLKALVWKGLVLAVNTEETWRIFVPRAPKNKKIYPEKYFHIFPKKCFHIFRNGTFQPLAQKTKKPSWKNLMYFSDFFYILGRMVTKRKNKKLSRTLVSMLTNCKIKKFLILQDDCWLGMTENF